MRTYRAGSLTLTIGSKTLVGVDTAFLSNVDIGAVIICENSQCFEVVAVPDDTHLTVDVAAKSTGSFQYCAVRFATAVNFRDLSIKIEQFLGDRQNNLNEFQAWQTGTKDGGPNGDGKYPITDRYGVVGLYSCPEKLSFGYDEAENQVEAAAASAAAALVSQTAAAASEDAAEAFRIDAGESSSSAAAAAGAAAGSKVDAETAAAAALASKNAAATSETNAAGSATAANTSKVNAATSETNAAASAAAALASKNAAATSKTQAESAQTQAATSASQAATSASQAAASETSATNSKNAAATSAAASSNWAALPEDQVVSSGKYSSLHYASKADQSAEIALDARNATITAASEAEASRVAAVTASAAAVGTANDALELLESGNLPDIIDDNATFIAEGGDIAVWDTYNGTSATVGSDLGFPITIITKTNAAGVDAGAACNVTNPTGNSDFIQYMKVVCPDGTIMWAYDNTTPGWDHHSVWFGSATQDFVIAPGRISIRGKYNGVETFAAAPKTYNFANDYLEVALHYCNTQKTLCLWVKELGKWEMAVRVQSDRIAPTKLGLVMSDKVAVNSRCLIQYQMLALPNIIVYGDSISIGETDYNPTWGSGKTNSDAVWAVHAGLYPMLRNNLPVLKGAGGWTSQLYADNIAHVTNTKARVVFLHASSNDASNSVTQASRTTLMQTCIDAMNKNGMNVVLLNQLPATQAHFDNATGKVRDYCHSWWTNYRHTLRGVTQMLDISRTLAGVDGYQDAALTQVDGVHPTIDGYKKIGYRMRYFGTSGTPTKKMSQSFNPRLSAIAEATMTANQMLVSTGTSTVSPVNVTPYVQGLFGGPTDAGSFRTAVSAERIPKLADLDSTTDWNNLPITGGWSKELVGPNNANSPQSGAYFYPLTLLFGDGKTQIAFPFGSVNSGGIFWRCCYQNTWFPWRRVINSLEFSTFGLSLINQANATNARTYLGADSLPSQTGSDGAIDWNNFTAAGWYSQLIGSGNANAPAAIGYFHAYNIWYSNNGSITQFAYPYASSGNSVIYWRTRFGGVWQPWQYTMTSSQFSSFGMNLVAMTSLPTIQAHLGLVPTANNADTTTGRLMTVGYGGIGGVGVAAGASAGNPTGRTLNDPKAGGLYSYYLDTIGPWSSVAVNMLEGKWAYDGTWGSQLAMGISNSEIMYRSVRSTSEAGQTRPWTRLVTGMNVVGPVTADFDATTTSGIMEWGYNANGEYWKFYNGMLVCKTVTTGYTTVTAKTMPWPHAFLTGATIGVSHAIIPNGTWEANGAAYGDHNNGYFWCSGPSNAVNSVVLTGIGRWK